MAYSQTNYNNDVRKQMNAANGGLASAAAYAVGRNLKGSKVGKALEVGGKLGASVSAYKFGTANRRMNRAYKKEKAQHTKVAELLQKVAEVTKDQELAVGAGAAGAGALAVRQGHKHAVKSLRTHARQGEKHSARYYSKMDAIDALSQRVHNSEDRYTHHGDAERQFLGDSRDKLTKNHVDRLNKDRKVQRKIERRAKHLKGASRGLAGAALLAGGTAAYHKYKNSRATTQGVNYYG